MNLSGVFFIVSIAVAYSGYDCDFGFKPFLTFRADLETLRNVGIMRPFGTRQHAPAFCGMGVPGRVNGDCGYRGKWRYASACHILFTDYAPVVWFPGWCEKRPQPVVVIPVQPEHTNGCERSLRKYVMTLRRVSDEVCVCAYAVSGAVRASVYSHVAGLGSPA